MVVTAITFLLGMVVFFVGYDIGILILIFAFGVMTFGTGALAADRRL
ncbi:hypothetical protein [Glaciihabitans tibetensis]|nr:hypothetical protein [Glaciihabitans tibetensis]